ncbi:MAG: 1-acyl-sn-glycerol-3-phosphate acyltransferase [Proteobacteria bacterium]|nr:1-acyl-sn-glycerol-3-phosphate acyltransferase [Pseudomonadota bacterium]
MRSSTPFDRNLRFLGMIALIAGFAILATLQHAFFKITRRNEAALYRAKARWIGIQSRLALRLLKIGVRFRGAETLSQPGGLIVCNHLSYIDILILSSQMPALYITSVETGSQGWIGRLCRIAGCVFVERRNPAALKHEIGRIETLLRDGIPVVLFPEATSTDGSDVLPFKSGLYECALGSKTPIHSFCIRYAPHASGVPYHGDMTLLPHLYELCDGLPRIATLEYLDTLPPSDTLERKDAARKTHTRIRNAYVSRMARTRTVEIRTQPGMQT